MAKKIYLSPSDQIHNAYAYGNTNEAEMFISRAFGLSKEV